MARPIYHQDYIARIRYSNTLPEPPFPPKLLDIPNTGLSSGQYTGAGFASRLAREQPLNIEADAELGMPIDLVGLPRVFEDDPAIHFDLDPPQLDAKDRALLRPLNSLGKPMSVTTGVSFLRRTEYITAAATVNRYDSRNAALRTGSTPKRRRVPDVSKDDPINILRNIIKGFDLAYPRDAYRGQDGPGNMRGADISQEEREAWARPRHPTNPNLKLLDKYPVLPDLEAFPDTGNYMILKFQNNPSTNKEYDPRLDLGLIQPVPHNPEEEARYEELVVSAAAEGRPKPIPEFRYEYFLPANSESVTNIKRKFNTLDPENDSDELYDETNADTGRRSFKYKRIRSYETYTQVGNPDDPWNDSIAMVLHDPDTAKERRLQKGAFIYPVVQRTSIRAARPRNMAMLGTQANSRIDEEPKVDFVELGVRGPTEEGLGLVKGHVEKIDPPPAERAIEE
ncbi:Paf1 complex protein [Tothia fuscella]|uniref:Paf1 complex protein n=1 Tax=Tothia fuscella TaxID=1048955 RepID=A0A9P4NKE7_9PEZI|nr:Paf1 complex protein [Tothia fuscella]